MADKYVIQFLTWMENPRPVGRTEIRSGSYLKSYDPDANGGNGLGEWTSRLEHALQFPTARDAMACWRTQSTVRPYREDGRPNRPLTSASVQIIRLVSS